MDAALDSQALTFFLKRPEGKKVLFLKKLVYQLVDVMLWRVVLVAACRISH